MIPPFLERDSVDKLVWGMFNDLFFLYQQIYMSTASIREELELEIKETKAKLAKLICDNRALLLTSPTSATRTLVERLINGDYPWGNIG